MSRPTISVWMVSVPSKGCTASMSGHVPDGVEVQQDAIAAEQVTGLGEHTARLRGVVQLRQPLHSFRKK
jgi:hypothetical protein